MLNATEEFLTRLEATCDSRRDEIRQAADTVTTTGMTYYVSNGGKNTFQSSVLISMLIPSKAKSC